MANREDRRLQREIMASIVRVQKFKQEQLHLTQMLMGNYLEVITNWRRPPSLQVIFLLSLFEELKDVAFYVVSISVKSLKKIKPAATKTRPLKIIKSTFVRFSAMRTSLGF